jgi:hypothetical protein
VGVAAGALQAALAKALGASEGPAVLLACPQGAADVAALRGALAASAGDHVLLLSPVSGRPVHAHGRQLLQSASSSVVPSACDSVCQAQTAVLHFGAVFALFLILALSGVCCLHSLEGPSKFETVEAHQKHGINQ